MGARFRGHDYEGVQFLLSASCFRLSRTQSPAFFAFKPFITSYA
jgi:hypothetical protein